MRLSLLLLLSDSVWNWLRHLGAFGLVLLGLADSAPFMDVPPGSLDVALILLSGHRHEWWAYYALMATVGEVLGGYLSYRLGQKGGQQTLEKKLGKARAAKFYKRFEKQGFITVFGGAILPPPFPFSPIPVAAGIMQYPRNRFISALSAGRAVRFFGEAFLGRLYGQQMIAFFSRHYKPTMYALIALAVIAGIGALIYYKWYLPRERQREGQDKGGSTVDSQRNRAGHVTQ